MGVFFGLTGGALEVALRGAQLYALDARVFLSRDLVWMAPLADVVFFLAVAGALVLASRAVMRVWAGAKPLGNALVLGTFLFLLPLGPLLSTTRIHKLASLLLALGVAVQGGRLLARWAPAVLQIARRATPVLALAVVTGLALVRGGSWLKETRHLAELPAAEPDAPNVLLLILDTVRSADMSLYGYGKPTTPHLERLARGGVTFERALSTSPWTLPSHASMFTGRYPHELSADWQAPLDDTDPTLADWFARRGYRTGGFVANLIYATWETGLDRGFARYEDYPVSASMVVNSSWIVRRLVNRARRWLGDDRFLVRKSAADVNSAFLDWVEGTPDRPFFAFLNYMDAHAPYLPPDSLVGKFGPRRTGRALADLSDRSDWTAEELEAERAAYDGTIAYIDQEIGLLIAELRERELLDNTLLIVTSDHGEQFGEHGLVDHGNSLYRPLLDVPLLMVLPGKVPAGLRVAEPVTLRDLAKTIADLATGTEATFPGSSLARFWLQAERSRGSPLLSTVSGGVRMPVWVPVSKGDMRSLVLNGFHYIVDGTGREELYDYRQDLEERRDLAGVDAEAGRLRELRTAVEKLVESRARRGR